MGGKVPSLQITEFSGTFLNSLESGDVFDNNFVELKIVHREVPALPALSSSPSRSKTWTMGGRWKERENDEIV